MTQLSDFAIGFFLFTVLGLVASQMLLVLMHIGTQRKLMQSLELLSKDQIDGFSKLMQTTLLHIKASTPMEAVQLQVSLEREQAALEASVAALEQGLGDPATPREPPKKYIGYKGADGRVFEFKTQPPPSFLEGIDKSRLVEAPQQ